MVVNPSIDISGLFTPLKYGVQNLPSPGTNAYNPETDPRYQNLLNMIEELRSKGMNGQADQIEAMLQERFHHNFFQNMDKLFGNDRAARSFYDDIFNKANEIGANALETYRVQEYNSEDATLSRERSAGLNPDLAGITNSAAGQAAQNPEVADAPMPVSSDGGSFVSDFAQIAGSAFSFSSILESGLTIANQVMDFAGKRLNFTRSEVESFGAEFDTVMDTIAKLWPTEADPISGEEGLVNLSAAQIQELYDGLDLSPRSRKLLKYLSGRVSHDENGNPTTGLQQRVRELRRKSLEDAQKSVGIMSSPGFSHDMMKWSQTYYDIYGQYENKLKEATVKYENDVVALRKQYVDKATSLNLGSQEALTQLDQYLSDSAEFGYNQQYYDSLDPETMAGSQNARSGFESSYYNSLDPELAAIVDKLELKQRKLEATFDTLTDEVFNDLLDSIDENISNEDVKTAARIGVYQARSKYRTSAMARRARAISKAESAGALAGNPVSAVTSAASALNPKK